MDIVTTAKIFASELHKNQKNNDTVKTPYLFHLEEVAKLVADSGGSDEEIAAAWLHDAVEDTDVTLDEIRDTFGNGVATMVESLTDLPDWVSLPQNVRKAKQAERITKASASVKRVKLADQTSNVQIVGRGTMVDWNAETHLMYVDGARQIAEACRGVSSYLDELFDERYIKAQLNLGRLQSDLR